MAVDLIGKAVSGNQANQGQAVYHICKLPGKRHEIMDEDIRWDLPEFAEEGGGCSKTGPCSRHGRILRGKFVDTRWKTGDSGLRGFADRFVRFNDGAAFLQDETPQIWLAQPGDTQW